jgi:DNA invertase Pin-like site-specific DNA recombinase
MTADTSARRIACAIYTRKSTDDGMDKEFTSIEAQRLAAEQYIAQHQARGYYALPDQYDDPGYSGGNLNRPAFKRLLADVEAGRIGCVMVYKTDRLSRSLFDGLMTIQMLRDRGVEFISVTEKIDAPESIEKLIRNNLLVTGEYYRDLTSERIRDKIRLAKEKGMNCGGTPPLGYDVVERKLVVNDAEAEMVRHIFRRFTECGSATQLVRELKAEGIRTKSWTTKKKKARVGQPFHKQNIYRLLHNRKYLGEMPHKDKVHKGEHQAIVDRKLWDAAHAIIARNPRERANGSRAKTKGAFRPLLKVKRNEGGLPAVPMHGCQKGGRPPWVRGSENRRAWRAKRALREYRRKRLASSGNLSVRMSATWWSRSCARRSRFFAVPGIIRRPGRSVFARAALRGTCCTRIGGRILSVPAYVAGRGAVRWRRSFRATPTPKTPGSFAGVCWRRSRRA